MVAVPLFARWIRYNQPSTDGAAWLVNTAFYLILAIAAVAAVGIGVVTAARSSGHAQVEAGGIRWRRGQARIYVPFAGLVDAKLEPQALGGLVLRLVSA